MTFDAARARAALDAAHGLATFTALTTPMHVHLMTANGTATSAGTELSTSGGYDSSNTGAPSVTFGSATSPSTSSNSGSVSVTNMPAATIVGIEVKDNGGTRAELGALTSSKTTQSGDTLSFAAAAITSTLS